VMVYLWLQRGVTHIGELEARLGLTLLATVPESGKSRRQRAGRSLLTTQAGLHDLALEGVRSLYTALHFSSLDRSSNTTVLTGPSPEIGKTFLSVHLGAVMAGHGQRILVIDADMRRGHMHEYFNASRERGLSEIIAQGLPWQDAVRETHVPGLFFLSTGTLPPSPTELLLHERFTQLLDALKTSYDHIIIDTPPVLSVTDAVIVARHCGVTLLVARYAVSRLEEIDLCQKRLLQAGVPLGGLILNRVRSNERYYYYDYRSARQN